jgi:hypothetical protein
MKLQQGFLFLLLISFLSIAATSEKTLLVAATNGTETPVAYPMSTQEVHEKKLNFLQRLMFKLTVKKFKKVGDIEKADRQASSALIFGIAALGTLIIGLSVPVVALAAIPAGVVAMVLGKQAVIGGTNDPAKAKIGKTLGLVSLLVFAFILLLGAIVVASWGFR